MKRTVTLERNVPSKRARAVSKKIKLFRVPRGSFGTLVRSIAVDQTIVNGTTTGSGLAVNSSGVYINDTLTSWAGATDISNAYDAYRITKVIVEFTYNQNTSNVNQTATTMPWIYTAPDYDDAGGALAANVTKNNILQKDGIRVRNFSENGGLRHVVKYVPKIAIQAYGAATGYMEPKAYQWVSTGTLGTGDPKHYGLWSLGVPHSRRHL